MSNILFIAYIRFKFLTTSFKDEGFDFVVTIGVDECGKVFGVGLGVEEGG